MTMPMVEAPFKPADALSVEPLERAAGQNASPGKTRLINYIPGEPTLFLSQSEEFLRKELISPVLEELVDDLWLVAKRTFSNIDTLHRQIIKGRDIVATEDPRLHLVWQEDKIFIKPIPLCLLNHDFWMYFVIANPSTSSIVSPPSDSLAADYQSEGDDSYRAQAMGFLRSYAFLIQHRSDLRLAKEHNLIPDDVEVDWAKWSKFIAGFRNLMNEDVAKRYCYGQLRLTRLNWATRIFRPKSTRTRWFYEEPSWSTMPYIRQAVVPLAFLFASLSLLLASMQVMLAVPIGDLSDQPVGKGGQEAIQLASWGFAITVLFFSGISLVLLALIPLVILLIQLLWAIRHSREKKNLGRHMEGAA